MDEKSDRRARGPVLIALLIFFTACGVSLDFFVRQSQILAVDGDSSLTFGKVVKFPTSIVAPTGVQPVDPFAVIEPAPLEGSTIARNPSSDSLTPQTLASELVAPATPTEIDLTAPVEDLKISLDASKWKGAAQLLPSPMYISQISDKPSGEIRGGGWLVVDVANSRILEVELFKSEHSIQGRRVVEAKYPNGQRAVDPYNAGFPIVRGVKDLHVGGFEVFENPPCLVRAMNVNEEEICEVTLRGAKFRYKFSPPAGLAGNDGQEFPMADVSIETGPGRWKKIASFNESFQPLGDPNHDGIPDFYAESVTSLNESGFHLLLLSHEAGDEVEYRSYKALFKANR